MLRKLDRYIILSFIPDFLVTLFAISGMFVVVDLFQNLGEYVQLSLGEALTTIWRYYGFFIPASIPDWVPAITLVAAGLTLVRLAKDNELLAMKASGVSMARILVPIFVAATLISLLSAVDREFMVPRIWRKKIQLEEGLSGTKEERLCTADDRENRMTVRVWKYDRQRGVMKSVFVIYYYEGHKIRSILEAQSGEWVGGKLQLHGVTRQDWSEDGRDLGRRSLDTFIVETNLKPGDLAKSPIDAAAMSIFDLRQLCKEHPNSYDFQLNFHSRIADPFRGIVLLLIGVPFMLGFDGMNRSRFMGILKSVIVCAAFYTFGFVVANLSKNGHLNPLLAAWMPTVMFGAGGLLLFDSMRS